MAKWNKKRIFLSSLMGGGLGIIFLLVVAWNAALLHFLRAEEVADQVRWLTTDFNNHFFEARRAEKDFLLNDLRNKDFFEQGDSPNLAKQRAAMVAVVRDIETLSGLVSGELSRSILSIRILVKEYNDAFQKLALAYREKGFKDWGIEGEWRKAIHAVEQRMREPKSAAARANLLQLRRDEKDYLLRGEPKYVVAVSEGIKRLAEPMLAAHFSDTNTIATLEDLKRYDGLFKKYLAINEQIGTSEDVGLRGDLRHAAHQIEPLVDGILKQAKQDIDAARQQLLHISAAIAATGLILAGSLLYFLGTHSPADAQRAPENDLDPDVTESVAAAQPANVDGLSKFVLQFPQGKPSDNVMLLSAWLYGRYGLYPITAKEIKELGDACGLITPTRSDNTMWKAQRKGKKLFNREGNGWQPTVSCEMFFAEHYGVKKGDKPLPL